MRVVTNSDDFIWRLVKGCIQLGFVPDINNTVNMVPVDHVARITALSALYASSSKAAVYHVTSRPAVRFNDLLSLLSFYGYSVTRCEYVAWRRKLEIHVLDPVQEENRDNALFPLLHFVLDDLPTSTKAPELNDQHTSALLRLDGVVDDGNVSVGEELMGKYLAWLIQAGFLPAPEGDGKSKLPETQKGSIVGKALGRSGR
jgi:L-aminoadipate-semialdehyde dehydrogenase